MTRAARSAALAAALLIVPSFAAAQDLGTTRCNAVNTPSTRQFMEKLPSGQYNTYMGGGVIVHCPAKQINLRADSMEQYGDDRRFYLVGHVFYQEPRFSVHSDFLNYFMGDERVVATGNVDATMPSGSRLRGPTATYLRPIPARRPLAQMLATQRPTITLVQKDSLGRLQPPMQVVANTVFMNGDSLVYGGGKVEITRDKFTAHGDSMFLDGPHEIMHLLRDPGIEGTNDSTPFTLVGRLIDLYSHNRKLERVLARGKAVATSKDMKLHADTIDLRITNDVLERAIAWGPGRASAKSPADSLLADSIDVIMPGQHVREIHALGKAYAESKPDTVKFRTKDMDWMKGDTIIAFFDSIPARDTVHSPSIRRIIAIDSASAYYNMAPRDTMLCSPAVSYSKGDRITVTFGPKGVDKVDVVGQTQGILAEPDASDTTNKNICRKTPAKKPDGKPPAAKPDSSAIRRPPAVPMTVQRR
ncbi:MAG TPA: hypothetical protein VMV51_02585 [Gemmatimonadaceae bacterium]|nr:hypothetical protein [Gemmatimonadaceae bacterium]